MFIVQFTVVLFVCYFIYIHEDTVIAAIMYYFGGNIFSIFE